MGNIELHGLGLISRNRKDLFSVLVACVFELMKQQLKRFTARFQTLVLPYYFARVNRSRSKTHKETKWQHDHRKAMDARRGSWKHHKGTIVIRWQEDEKYRFSQQAHGWTEEYCRYLDDISHTAPWHQRHRYENTITLVCSDEDRQAGPMTIRKDSKPTTKILASLRQEQGRQNSFIPKTRQQGKDHSMEYCKQN